MRTILAGVRVAIRDPRTLLPLSVEGLAVSVLIAAGAFPAGGSSAAAGAAFPLDLFFDLKQALAFGRDWTAVAAALSLAVLVRGAVLAGTLWLADEAPGPFAVAWVRACRLAGIALLAFVPSATFLFTGVATRYAPFIWIGGLLGFVPAVLVARRAARLDAGAGEPKGAGVPEAPAYLAYALLIAAYGAAMSVLGESGRWGPALLAAFLGPVHALFLLGWREHLRTESYPGGGTLAATATALVAVLLVGTSVFDRYLRELPPIPRADERTLLLVLQGVDTTPETGALADLDARDLGFEEKRTLSYVGQEQRYDKVDTRGDLDDIARAVLADIESTVRPSVLVGHSQAALILDRMIDDGLTAPQASAMLAPPPPYPPPIEIPPPDDEGPGKPGGDLARGLAELMDLVGLNPFDVDASAAPTHLETLVVEESPFPRLAVWALGDSVWLSGDWRRPGETNVVALTDHVGVTGNSTAVDTARSFLAGEDVEGQEASWQGLFVSVLRYTFEPWRPG